MNADHLAHPYNRQKSGSITSRQRLQARAVCPSEWVRYPRWGLFFAALVRAAKRAEKYLAGNDSKKRFLRPSRHSLPLHYATKGSKLVIVDIPQGQSRVRLIRLGIVKGAPIKCLERLAGGTVVIEKSRQEIAIGAALAKTILVAYRSAERSAKSEA